MLGRGPSSLLLRYDDDDDGSGPVCPTPRAFFTARTVLICHVVVLFSVRPGSSNGPVQRGMAVISHIPEYVSLIDILTAGLFRGCLQRDDIVSC
mmetsp:Transcript_60174/g.147877  ORF Transcript_60174/g.147877 Transcript_60174/m.147877 type:complete len:94 (+) Transcript_60174:39-320(+)